MKIQQKVTLKSKRHLSKEVVIKAIRNSYGNVTTIAKKLHCERKTVYEWLNKYEELKELLLSEREKIIDLAESKLITKINAGSEAMIALVLTTLGKQRGYIKTVEHSGSISLKNLDYSKLTDEQLKILKNKIRNKENVEEYLASLGMI